MQTLDLGPAHLLVAVEGLVQWMAGEEQPGEGDGVLHGQLGARAHREMGGVDGVADEHDIAVVPALTD